MLEILEEARREAPSVEHVIAAPWDELVAGCPGELPALEVESETPYLLTYTSGTTGEPKGVVHVQGGFLVSIAREACYQADVRAGRRRPLRDATWAGSWARGRSSASARSARTVVYARGRARLARRPAVAHGRGRSASRRLGLSPTLARALLPHGDPTHDLSSLRTFVTTGEPWNPEPYRWLYENGRRRRACRSSTSRAAPRSPRASSRRCRRSRSRRARSAGPSPGMAMDVVDDDGRSLVGTGEVGELVCRKPFPGMTRGFWRDPERYLDTYWRRIPGVWVHGDWASVDADGYWFLHGRSDDTLNIAGKRIGPAELESAAVAHPAVREAAAVGVPHEVKGETAWIFCCLLPGYEPSDELAAEIERHGRRHARQGVRPGRRRCSSRRCPKTRSAKIVRRARAAAALGADPGDLSSLENPESLDAIAAAVG